MVTEEIEQLAVRARQLAAIGHLQAAREHWQAALYRLPYDAPERSGVEREIARLTARLVPRPPVDWRKRLGPLGIVIAALAKFKTTAFVLLTKGKFLFSILAFVGVYWALFGWWFAIGLAGSVLIHEMGHYLVVRRFGFKAELPMFIPLFGAYVKWRGADVDAAVRSKISLAGPLFGFVSGLLAYGIYLSTHQGVWLAVAQFAGWLNLINLIPVSILDGGTGLSAVGTLHRMLLVAICVALGLTMGKVFFFVAAGTAYRLWKRDAPAHSDAVVAYSYMFLVVANGWLSWFCTQQARGIFGSYSA